MLDIALNLANQLDVDADRDELKAWMLAAHDRRAQVCAATEQLAKAEQRCQELYARQSTPLLNELTDHISASPLGWIDGRRPIVHRSTTDADVVEWLGRLKHLRNRVVLEVLEASEPDLDEDTAIDVP